MVKILELVQGRPRLDGQKVTEVVEALVTPFWRFKEVTEAERPPFGYEWYRMEPDGTLVLWKANHDSSG